MATRAMLAHAVTDYDGVEEGKKLQKWPEKKEEEAKEWGPTKWKPSGLTPGTMTVQEDAAQVRDEESEIKQARDPCMATHVS